MKIDLSKIAETIKNLHNLYSIIFTQQERKALLELIYKNIRIYIKEDDKIFECFANYVIEELIIYCIASNNQKGLEVIKEINNRTNILAVLRTKSEYEALYKKYIDKIRKFLDDNGNSEFVF